MSADRHPPTPPAAAPVPLLAPVPAPVPAAALLAAVEHDALPPGTRFGEFEILRVLGVGGFGIVYLAQDHSLERPVALKEYMPAALAARLGGAMVSVRSASFAETYAMGLRSFINEARLLARFDHPSLVKVYRFWEDNGTAYMVMPYLQGRTLRDARRMMGKAPEEGWIRGVLMPVLDALQLLHREGVFHRDIAPDNILLPPEGLPILLDFGAARHVIGDQTQSLTAILKPSYAPIEQYAEMAAMRQGPWTDLYALGAVLHYLLFGAPPSPATARAVEPDAEPIELRVVPGVSPRFIGIVGWMLGVRPIERPQSVAALRAVLDGEESVPAGVRHDATFPGFRAPLAPALISTPPHDAIETHADTAHQPTQPLPRTARAAAPGTAPMRSAPPGRPPPAYLPPTHVPPLQSPASASAMPAAAKAKSRRRAPWLGASLAASALVAGLLWKFAAVVDPAPQAVPQPMAATSAAASLPGPAAQTAGIAVPPAAVAPVVSVAAETGGRPASASAPASAFTSADDRVPPQSVATSAGDAAATDEGVSSKPAGEAAHPHSVAQRNTASKPTYRVAAGPASARAACEGRNFISEAICMDRECERPRFRRSAECVRVLEVKRLRAER